MTADVPAEAETPRVDLDRAEQLATSYVASRWDSLPDLVPVTIRALVAELRQVRDKNVRLTVERVQWESEAIRHSENYDQQFARAVTAEAEAKQLRTAVERVEALRDRWDMAQELGSGQLSIVTRAFAAEIAAALSVGDTNPEADQ